MTQPRTRTTILPMSARRLLLSVVVGVAALLASMARLLAPSASERPAAPVDATRDARVPAPVPQPSPLAGPALDEGALRALGDANLAAQIRRVVASLDATGRPPDGVAQGGRRGGSRGTFQNAEGRLPRRAPGYYVESDVWPRGPTGRGALRLIVGRQGEVFFSSDHYRSFVRLR